MTVVYITEPTSVLRYEGGSLAVWVEALPEDDEGPRRRRRQAVLEPHRLEAIILDTSTHITVNAMRACTAHRIPVSILDGSGNLAGRVTPPESHTADLRLNQYRQHEDAPERLIRARAVVAAKLANGAQLLRSVRANHPSDSLATAMSELETIEAQVAKAEDVDQLRGIEGNGARHYFAGLATAFRGDITFTRRAQRPPPDPANSMLSFGYVLLSNRIAGLIEARGADPCLGFFHEVRPGRPALALDLLEEMRHPIVDRFVLRIANRRQISPNQFEDDPERPGGVRLSLEGRRAFLHLWEEFLARPVREAGAQAEERLDVHRLIRRQVDRVVSDLRGGEIYRPFRFDG